MGQKPIHHPMAIVTACVDRIGKDLLPFLSSFLTMDLFQGLHRSRSAPNVISYSMAKSAGSVGPVSKPLFVFYKNGTHRDTKRSATRLSNAI